MEELTGMRTEAVMVSGIPLRIVYPWREEKKEAVLFYHGWSSTGALQMTRAAILAAYGYTVFVPDAIHHGKRGTLPDYYAVSAYDFFWQTVLQNVEEFPRLRDFLKEKGYERPWVMGHSMGGITAMGLAAHDPEDLRGAVSFNGSGDWLLSHLFLQARFGVLLPRDWPLYDRIAAASPMAHLAEVKKVPLFMTNGEADSSVDPRAQARFAAAWEAAGGRGVRLVYPGLGHFVTTNMMDDAIRWMKSFH